MSTDRYRAFRAANLPQTGLAAYLPVNGVEVKLLDGCNRSCAFCVNEDHIGKELNPVDAERFVRSVRDWWACADEAEKPEAVFGTGGEPLMAMDLVARVFAPLAALGLTTRLVTNGTLLTADRIARLVDIGLTGVKVTYNTLDGERLTALMKGGHPGDTAQLLDNIARAKAAGLWVFVRMGLGRHNADEVAAIYRVMRDLGVDVVQVKPWIPSGYAAEAGADLSLRPRSLYDRLAEAMVELHEELAAGGPELTISCFPPARDLQYTVKDCANVAKIYCEPGGEAMVCNFTEEYLGSWYPEEGGLLGVVTRRRELYRHIVDQHGVASCPARLNWSTPSDVVSRGPAWKSQPVVFPVDTLRSRLPR
jgi:molybdenum cofactor biosynthesis enzyme MoaA